MLIFRLTSALAGIILLLLGGLLTYQRQQPSGAYWLIFRTSTGHSVHYPDGAPYAALPQFGNFLAWSPDTETIFYQTERGLVITDYQGHHRQVILRGKENVYFINPIRLTLAPNERQFLVQMPISKSTSALYVVAVDGTHLRELSPNGGWPIVAAYWTADSQAIEVLVEATPTAGYTITLATTTITPHTQPPATLPAAPNVNRFTLTDGSTLAQVTTANTTRYLWTTNRQNPSPDEVVYTLPTGATRLFARLSPDERWLYVGYQETTANDFPRTVVRVRLADGHVEPLATASEIKAISPAINRAVHSWWWVICGGILIFSNIFFIYKRHKV